MEVVWRWLQTTTALRHMPKKKRNKFEIASMSVVVAVDLKLCRLIVVEVVGCCFVAVVVVVARFACCCFIHDVSS